MLAVQGFYDGTAIRTLEKINAKPNQRVIITILDEFVASENITEEKGMRGILSEYADPDLKEKEKNAWKNAVVKKYGNT